MRPSAKVLSGDVAERYAIEGEIGRGGTAVVYRAHDRVRGIDVAIKLMRDDAMGSLSIERFLLEIRQTAKLPHPHIVPVLDSGEIEGRPYFVLPFMDGGTLRERLLRQKQLQYEEVITLGVTIARALEFAHAHGVIHRDVKPENILYNNGQPCLADFGTARALERAVNDPTTSTGVVRGTAAYMSPEQASGEREYDGRTDIYSLACVLYEAIAGIQPFVGPTMQAVIAQRLTHSPRPVSVYRPTVPQELEQVLMKATALVPADRYQRAGELAEALEESSKSPTQSRSTPAEVRARITRSRGLLIGGVIMAAASVIVAIAGKTGVPLPFIGRLPAVDTTLIAIMPVEMSGRNDGIIGQELLVEGLRAWSGVSAVETFATNDAIRRRNTGLTTASVAGFTVADVSRITAGLGAGRFIRARLIDASGLRLIYGTLYDVRSKRDLYHSRVRLPDDSTSWPNAYRQLTDSLMLRGQRPDSARSATDRPTNLPAYQTFLAGRRALAQWNLPAAESMFSRSVAFDTTMGRARLWRAQVGNWRRQPIAVWAPSAIAASRDTSLLPTERRIARALAALGSGKQPEACTIYRALTRQYPRDFAAWYGLGECHWLDRIVVADAKSPSGWRFRSSYEEGLQAYRQAFELLPSAYRTVEASAFEPLRARLYTFNTLRRGGRVGESPFAFFARLTLANDTVVFIPYLRDTVRSGPPVVDPNVVGEALRRNRRIFRDLVLGWNNQLPGSQGAREAVAVSLEMLGDPAAADSFHAIRASATLQSDVLRLGVQEAMARLKFAISERNSDAEAARGLIDSIIDAARPVSAADAELLSRLSTLTGRCAMTAALVARFAPVEHLKTLPPTLVRDVNDAFAQWAGGCGATTMFPRVAESLRRSGVSTAEAELQEYELIGSAVAMRFPNDGPTIERLAKTSSDYILTAEASLLNGDTATARRLIGRYRQARLVAPLGELGPDAALIEAQLWAAMGDTLMARQLIDRVLAGVRYAQPLQSEYGSVNLLRLGSIVPAIEFRAKIESDPRRKKRLVDLVAALWARGDPGVQDRVARLRASAGRQ